MKFSLLLPTRGRPQKLNRLLKSIEETMSHEHEIEVQTWIDSDDKSTIGYIDHIPEFPFRVVRNVKERNAHVLGGKWNWLYRNADAEVYMICGDDLVFRARGWDTRIADTISKYPDRIVMVFGGDLGHIGTHPFLTKNVCETLGYITWEESPSWYHETWLIDIFERLKRITREIRVIRLDGVIIEHMHYQHGKAKADKTYHEAVDARLKFKPGETFLKPENVRRREEAARKLASVVVKR